MFEASLADAHGLPRQATAARRLADLLLEGCDPARTPALSSSQLSSQLSTREREVALLAADGMTSRDIADRLFVSPRTVDNHLQRVYTKLGVTSRAELSRRLESAPAS